MVKNGVATGLFISCPCGSKAAIVRSNWGFYSHCPGCGRLSFFRSEALVEKIRLGAKRLCDHKDVVEKDCKGGKTSWCPRCRLRVFITNQ
ncbi:hypothetical protein ACFLVK_00020 [Chloroflexota bacterium]